jgi:hypothetical protein
VVGQFEWIMTKEGSVVLESDYDPLRKSYYLFAGKIQILMPNRVVHITEHL